MQLNSSNPSNSAQLSPSPSSSSTHKPPTALHRRPRHRRRQSPPPSPTPSSTSQHTSSTPNNNIIENQFNSSYSSHSINSTSSPPIFLSISIPLPVFRGLPGECPVTHLTLLRRLFPSPDQISLNFPITLLDNAALWHELTVEPNPMSWDDTKRAFLRAFRLPEFADTARAELIALSQGDVETVNLYHLRMQWMLKRWTDHELPESLVRGLFVDGLREEFHDWVAAKRPETVEEAVEVAMDWEAARGAKKTRCGFCEGRHGESECEVRRKMREELMRRRIKEEENVVGEDEKLGRVVSIGSVGRKSQCQCWKHQCWKKYERSRSDVIVRNVNEGDATATAAATAGDAQLGRNFSLERIGGTMVAVGVFL